MISLVQMSTDGISSRKCFTFGKSSAIMLVRVKR